MVYDKITDLGKYITNSNAADFIQQLSKRLTEYKMEDGKHVVNDHVFYLRFDYQTKNADDTIWEAHRKYQDIHIVLEGEEQVWSNHISEMTPTNDYQNEGDYQLFEGVPNIKTNLTTGYFILFNPNDVHKTAVTEGEVSSLKKLVIKVLI